jgi:hypothetical protein
MDRVALGPRLPAVRNAYDKTMVITAHAGSGWGAPRVQQMEIARDSHRGLELTAPDNTIIVSEAPHRFRSLGVTGCLTIAIADATRQAGAVVHTYIAERFAAPLQFALYALNGRPADLRIGISGLLCTYGGKEEEIRARIAAEIGQSGRIIYNQMGKKGDIAIDFLNRTIGTPYGDITPAIF